MADPPIIVAVGSPDDLRSSVWRLWVQGDEVYFGARGALGFFKVSLHKSGKWRVAKVSSLDRPDKNTDRVFIKWRRPAEFAPGLTNGVMALISFMPPERPFRNKHIDDPRIVWLPLAQYPKILALIILIANKDADLDPSRFDASTRIVGRIKKADGEIVCLITYEMDDSAGAIAAKMNEEKSKIKISIKEGPKEAILLDATRALFVMRPGAPKEMPAIYDLPLGWENVEVEK